MMIHYLTCGPYLNVLKAELQGDGIHTLNFMHSQRQLWHSSLGCCSEEPFICEFSQPPCDLQPENLQETWFCCHGCLQGEARLTRRGCAWVWGSRWYLHPGLCWVCWSGAAILMPCWGLLYLRWQNWGRHCRSVRRIIPWWLAAGWGIPSYLCVLPEVRLRYPYS